MTRHKQTLPSIDIIRGKAVGLFEGADIRVDSARNIVQCVTAMNDIYHP